MCATWRTRGDRWRPRSALIRSSRDSAFLLKEVRAVASDAWHFVSEVDVGSFLEDFDFSFWRDLVDHCLELVVFERWKIHPHQVAIDTQHWRIVCGKVQIGSLLLGH